MLRANRLMALCCAAGVALIVAGLIIGTPNASVEGAYFDRANGVPVHVGVFSASKPGLPDPADGNLWIGAGLALVLLVVSSAVLRMIRRRHSVALPG
jgi:hypothetical protein